MKEKETGVNNFADGKFGTPGLVVIVGKVMSDVFVVVWFQPHTPKTGILQISFAPKLI